MSDERLVRDLRALDRPVEPDPAFDGALFSLLEQELARPARPRRPLILLLAAALLVALTVGTTLAIGSGLLRPPWLVREVNPAPSSSPVVSHEPRPTPTPTATPAAPSQRVAVAWPTAAPSEVAVPSSLNGQDFAFWTLDQRAPCCGSVMRISTSTGSREGIIDIPDSSNGPQFPVPVGPAGGQVLYVVPDGTAEHLRVQNAWTGADTELTSTSLLIAGLAIDPSGSTAYYMLYDRGMSAFQGLWAVPTNGGEPRLLLAARATTAMATLAAERGYNPQLAISNDGSWIVFVSCQRTGCEFHANHPDGTSEPRDWSNFHPGDHIIGIAGDLLIGSTECGQPTCDGFSLDLRTGKRWPLGGADQPFAPTQLIAGPRGPLLLSEIEEYDQGLWRVEALDLTDGSRSSAFGTTFQPTATIHLAANYLGWGHLGSAELPPGWFLIYRFPNTEALVVPPDYSAARAGAELETKLPFMKSSPP